MPTVIDFNALDQVTYNNVDVTRVFSGGVKIWNKMKTTSVTTSRSTSKSTTTSWTTSYNTSRSTTTSWTTTYNTSKATSRNTSKSTTTSWTTSYNTSHSTSKSTTTSWTTSYTTSWNTSKTTSRTTSYTTSWTTSWNAYGAVWSGSTYAGYYGSGLYTSGSNWRGRANFQYGSWRTCYTNGTFQSATSLPYHTGEDYTQGFAYQGSGTSFRCAGVGERHWNFYWGAWMSFSKTNGFSGSSNASSITNTYSQMQSSGGSIRTKVGNAYGAWRTLT